jgi:hypothetical protein
MNDKKQKGRPKNPPDEKRYPFSVSLTKPELCEIKEAAKKSGQQTSVWIRWSALRMIEIKSIQSNPK